MLEAPTATPNATAAASADQLLVTWYLPPSLDAALPDGVTGVYFFGEHAPCPSWAPHPLPLPCPLRLS